MLMRSASTPSLNSSWNRTSSDQYLSHSPEPEFLHCSVLHPKLKPISLSSLSPYSDHISTKTTTTTMCRAMSETDLRQMMVLPRTKSFARITESGNEEDSDSESDMGEDYYMRKVIMTSSGLGEARTAPVLEVIEDVCEVEGNMDVNLLVGGGDGSDGGGNRCGGGGGGSSGRSDAMDGNGGIGIGDTNSSNHGVIDSYYLKMIDANPGNSLVLGNYAKFLKEVKGEVTKAEEYCGRAILANPNDGVVLSMYADLIWRVHDDTSRAELYFEQAVKVAPNDWRVTNLNHFNVFRQSPQQNYFVVASYARFLWDMEKEEEDEKESRGSSPVGSASILQGGLCQPTILPPVAAA